MPGDTPNLLAGYNADFEVYQAPDSVVIHREMIHDCGRHSAITV